MTVPHVEDLFPCYWTGQGGVIMIGEEDGREVRRQGSGLRHGPGGREGHRRYVILYYIMSYYIILHILLYWIMPYHIILSLSC